VCQALLPSIVRVSQGDNFFGSYYGGNIFMTIACIIQVIFFYGVLNIFLMVGVADYYRRFILLEVMGKMIDTSGTNSCSTVSAPEFVDLTIPHNVTAWFSLRQIFVHFGGQYRQRIQLYTSYSLFLCAAFFGLLIYGLIVNKGTKTLALLTIISITHISFVTLSFIARMMLNGTRANKQFDVHSAILNRTQFIVRELIGADAEKLAHDQVRSQVGSQLMRGDRRSLESCDLLISSVLAILALEKSLNPIRLLGIPASTTMVQTLATGAAGSLAAGVRLFTHGTLN